MPKTLKERPSYSADTLQLKKSPGKGRAILEISNDIKQRVEKLCEDCGKRIPKARLDAMPGTQVCVGCKREEELFAQYGYAAPSSKDVGSAISESDRYSNDKDADIDAINLARI